MNNRPIGIFDSGLGGLTVLKEMERILPNEDIIYLGDTARVPYGNKSRSTIVKFSTENILFLLQKKVKIVVVACNTASALALEYLRGIFSVPIVGVIEAGARKAFQISANKRIGIIGTRSTIASGSYEKAILEWDDAIELYSKPCPLFVPLVEEGLLRGPVTRRLVAMYLKDLKAKKVDSLILGCTHYPLLKHEIGRYMGKTHIIDSAQEVAVHTKETLQERNLLSSRKKPGKKGFFVTDEPRGFQKLARLFLHRDIIKPTIVTNV
ncbi:MAG: glutamate racemase [Candidatus Omnitrophota bacterium]|nr:glutamate racemase [Candidatus Omnitrophota bacterium]